MEYVIWLEGKGKYKFKDKKKLYKFLEWVDIGKYEFKAWVKE